MVRHTPKLCGVTTLFSHPRQPRRDTTSSIATTIPAAPVHPRAARRTPLERPQADMLHAFPAGAVPSFLTPLPDVDLRPSAATWDAIASTTRQLRRAEITTIPSNIASRPLATRLAVRAFDLVSSGVLLVVSLPVMLFVALAVRLTSRGPVLHASWRIGQGGTMFRCLKFRSMVRDAEAQLPHLLAANRHLAEEFRTSHSLRRDPRVTFVGRLLRRTHLDELPQLLAVLTGKMSLVGPRPIVPKEMDLYGPSLADTLVAKPGIIGPWQVTDRQGGYLARVESDVSYVENRSLLGDLSLTVRAIFTVVRSVFR